MVARVGSTAAGTVGRASEKVPSPVQLSRPTKTRAPIPEARRPGRATRLSVAPLTPATSMIRKRAEQRGSEQGADGGEAAGGRHDGQRHRRRVTFQEAYGQRGQAATDGDERRLGTEHGSQAQRRQGRQHDAGQLAVDRRPAGLEAERGRVPAVAGQEPDGQPDQESAERHQGDRPPGGHLAIEQIVRQVVEQVGLRLADQGEETVGNGGDRDAQDRREHQSRQVRTGTDHHRRVERRGRRRWR